MNKENGGQIRRIFARPIEWIDRYTAEDFRLDGLVNIVSRERTDYYLPLTRVENR